VSQLPIIEYAGFHDVPREVIVERGGRKYVLDCAFDDDRDDYGEDYAVLVLPDGAYESYVRGERTLPEMIDLGAEVGRVRVADVTFDETRRRSIDDRFFRDLEGGYGPVKS
jgi:hypothetical protein